MKIKKTYILTALIAVAALAILIQIYGAESENGVAEKYQGKLKIFILAGQSNMSGKGIMPSSADKTNPNIYAFGNDYQWKLAVEPVDNATNQVDKVSEDLDAGFGPSMAFASTLLKRQPDMVIGLIPCARTGASIHEWQRNPSTDSLYGSCLKRARIAAQMGEIAGLLFFQGEQDALIQSRHPDQTLLPEKWGNEFKAFVESWRNDLNLPELPVVFAQIGTTQAPEIAPNWKVVQEQQRAVQLPFCRMIATDDLMLNDEVHFTTASYQIIGQRFAEAYLELVEGQ